MEASPLDKYILGEILGEGTYGTVHLAQEKATGKKYAVKKININKDNKAAVENEITIMKKLQKLRHANIVAYKDSFELSTTNQFVIVMKYCSGGNLETYIEKADQAGKPIPEKIILQFCIDLTLGLQYIHSNGILHRDMKPQNIIFDSLGTLKIADFGISKELSSKYAHGFCGTILYCAPEVFNEDKYDTEADVWSLGCILHMLCCLKPAFAAVNPAATVKKILMEEPGPISSNYSSELREMIGKMLNKNRKERLLLNSIIANPIIGSHLSEIIHEKMKVGLIENAGKISPKQEPKSKKK